MLNETQTKVLYMPSTPLNLLISVVHAITHAHVQRSQLVLIDQKNTDNNIYFTVLQNWKNSPFEKVFLTSGKAKGFQKIVERKTNFKMLAKIVKDFPAEAIAVGSDRRIEFQYLMHLRVSNSKSPIEGWYLDDGLYSYSGRSSLWFKDLVNSAIKKISYGFWWKEPKTVGASAWINQAWLFSPENTIQSIKKKACHQVFTEWFLRHETSEFVNLVLDDFGLNTQIRAQLKSSTFVILIPHPNNILKMDGYIQRLESFLAKAMELGKKVTVKYHPRSKGPDYLNLKQRYGTLVLPNDLAFEFMMPLLDSDTIILGDISSVLMTAKWLRPDITTIAVLNEEDSFIQKFKGVIEKLNIPIIPYFKAAFKFLK